MFKSGYVAIVGRANVGKSSILNSIMGQKVTIVSDKSQTTRDRIQAIYTDEEVQIIFVDTPGMHKPKNVLDDTMKKSILNSLKEVDYILFVVDISEGFGKGDKYMLEAIPDLKKTVMVLNKIDLINSELFNKRLKELEEYDVDKIAVSAINKETTGGIVDYLKKHLNEGPKYFPDDYITDKDFRFTVKEVIREKALNYLSHEVPHGIGVVVDSFDRDKVLTIDATIIVERDSHKGIVIGKKGRKLKGIGKAARIELEDIYGEKIMLNLWVKVKKNWRNSEFYVKEFGYKNE